MRKARDYQQFALEEIKRNFMEGINDVMIVSPTATGKGFLITELARGCQAKNNKFLFVVRGRNLVDQTFKLRYFIPSFRIRVLFSKVMF